MPQSIGTALRPAPVHEQGLMVVWPQTKAVVAQNRAGGLIKAKTPNGAVWYNDIVPGPIYARFSNTGPVR